MGQVADGDETQPIGQLTSEIMEYVSMIETKPSEKKSSDQSGNNTPRPNHYILIENVPKR